MQDGPSTYTPLFRRLFGDEQQRELEEANQLYAWVKAREGAFTETPLTIGQRVYDEFADFSDDIRNSLGVALRNLIDAEQCLATVHPPEFGKMSLTEFVDYRNLLYLKQYFFTNQQTMLERLHEGLRSVLVGIGERLPVTEAPSPFTIPLVYTLPSPGTLIQQIFNTFCRPEYTETGLFKVVSNQLILNAYTVSGRDIHDEHSKKTVIAPVDSKLPVQELADRYLAETPFKRLFQTPVPLKLTHEDRFGHMHIIGGTGAGKTTLIENLILHDINSEDPPSIVLIDPHGDLIKKLSNADLGIQDRLIIIDPRDVENPPALNIFALNQERMKGYDQATREQVTAGVIQTFDYLFSGLTDLTLTGKQETFFRYVARLMLTLPEAMERNATILDMLKLMSDPTPYAKAIEMLPDIPREFFTRDFVGKTFQQTKDQIRYRLQAIIENPTMARLFTSPETKVDIFTEINRGSIILVDTAKDFLKGNSAMFGRLFISLTLQAVLERAAIPEAKRKPTFLFVDEAASFFDSNMDDLLTEARKYKCGIVLAHQYLDQATSGLRASLNANTGIKFAGATSAADARAMANEMRTTADFILGQPKLQFAAYIKNVTPQAVSIPIKPVTDQATLEDWEYERLIERNRLKVSLGRQTEAKRGPPPVSRETAEPAPTAVETPSTQSPDEDISKEW